MPDKKKNEGKVKGGKKAAKASKGSQIVDPKKYADEKMAEDLRNYGRK